MARPLRRYWRRLAIIRRGKSRWLCRFLPAVPPTISPAASLIGFAPVIGFPIVIENKAGAGGIIGAKAVIAAPPDGYTLLVSAIASVLVPPYLSTPPAFDARKDLTPITASVRFLPFSWSSLRLASRPSESFSPMREPIRAS